LYRVLPSRRMRSRRSPAAWAEAFGALLVRIQRAPLQLMTLVPAAAHTGRSFNGRTRGSGPRYRGSNPCLPATSLARPRSWLVGSSPVTSRLAELAANGRESLPSSHTSHSPSTIYGVSESTLRQQRRTTFLGCIVKHGKAIDIQSVTKSRKGIWSAGETRMRHGDRFGARSDGPHRMMERDANPEMRNRWEQPRRA
jgi:hypothetical protein